MSERPPAGTPAAFRYVLDNELSELREQYSYRSDGDGFWICLLIDEIELLRARAVRCEGDAARLDWLERMAHNGDNIGDIDISGSWVTQVITVGDPDITTIRGEGATVRDAIDAAMR